MKIQFKNTPEQIQLAKQMGAKNKQESYAAQEILAGLIAPILNEAYLQADTTRALFEDYHYNAGEDPSLALDLYSDVGEGHFTVWSAPMPGGLPSNDIFQPVQEAKFKTYRLDSAVSYLKKWAAKGRLDVVAKGIERLMQEVLLRTNYQAWTVLLWALANARDYNNALQVRSSNVAATFTLDDYNNLLTYFRRLNSSWSGGTPVNQRGRPTDFYVSPEMMGKFRAMSYNAINTTGPNGLALSTSNAGSVGTVTLPEATRAEVYRTGGAPTFFGIMINELNELGLSQDYQMLFEDFIGNTTLPALPGSTTTSTFDPAVDELVLVIDASKPFAYRAIADDADTGSVFTMEPDDQYVKRDGKLGWFGGIEEGRMILEHRQFAAVAV